MSAILSATRAHELDVVWFNGSQVPRKGKVACKNIIPAFKGYLEPEENIRGTSSMPDYTGEIYLAI